MAGWILLAPYSLQIKPPTASPILSEVLLLEFRPIWCFIHFVEVRVVRPILWPSDANSWLIGKDSDAGKDCRQMEKRAAEDEMVGRHHQFNGYELGQTLGDSEGQRGLEYCSPWGHKESDKFSDWTTTIYKAKILINIRYNFFLKLCLALPLFLPCKLLLFSR